MAVKEAPVLGLFATDRLGVVSERTSSMSVLVFFF